MTINSPEDISGLRLWVDTRDTESCVQVSAGAVTGLTNLSAGTDFTLFAQSTRYPNDSGSGDGLGVYNSQTCLYLDPTYGGAIFEQADDARAFPRTFAVYMEPIGPAPTGYRRILDSPADDWTALKGVRLGHVPTTFGTYLGAGGYTTTTYALDWPYDEPFVMFWVVTSDGVDCFAERHDVVDGVPQAPDKGANWTVTSTAGGIDALLINGLNGSTRGNILNVFEYDSVLTAQQRLDVAQYAADAWHPKQATLTYTDGPNAAVNGTNITATATVTIT